MLELKNIVKDYVSGNNVTHALKGISVNFRKNEFVSILGASGCGKTTTLNIIGGLDRYTSGDLLINGKSTKDYTDRDWDTYRNHSIGFIFQTYNLIAHQNILKNVELALTISGVSKEERRNRAYEALKKVGLEGMEKKKPNQLSGGQCQRVAIARALINNPEILLADEPTGALDSETSVQIMDLLKEVAADRLVIMVTHNPDLAFKYSTRIVKMSDGLIVDDNMPFDGKGEEFKAVEVSKGKKKKSSMSLWTSMGLSLSNLGSKLRRTILVTIAGSIGIIGVSAVLAVSRGVKDFIGSMQNDMLSSYPIEIAEESVDYTSLMSGLNASDLKGKFQFDEKNPKIGVDSMINYLMTAYSDITKVKTNTINDDLLAYIDNIPQDSLVITTKNYNIDPTNNIFGKWENKGLGTEDFTSFNGLTQSYISELKTVKGFSSYASYVNLFTNFMNEVPDDVNYINDQYDVIYGEDLLSNSDKKLHEDELILVVDKNTTLTDLTLAQTGMFEHNEFLNIAECAIKENEYRKEAEAEGKSASEIEEYINEEIRPLYPYKKEFTYDEVINKEFYYFPQDTIYSYNEEIASAEKNITISYLVLNGSSFEKLVYLQYTEGALVGVEIDSTANSKVLAFVRPGEMPAPEVVTDTDIVKGIWVGGDLSGDSVYALNIAENLTSVLDLSTFTPVAAYPSSIDVQITPVKGYETKAVADSAWISNPKSANGMPMKIKSILRLKEDKNFGCLQRGLYYSKAFTDRFINDSNNAKLTKALENQLNNAFTFETQFKDAYVTYDYLDHSIDAHNPEVKHGYSFSINGDMSNSFADLFSSITGVNYAETNSVYLRSVSGKKAVINYDENENFESAEFRIAPQTIKIYPKSFDTKDVITDYLDKWNGSEDITLKVNDVEKVLHPTDRKELTYTDTIELIITVINTLIDAITISLVVFTSLSLVVSCFMIAVITYISVVERIKEIGVIRSLGGRKGDVASLFVMETLLTGLFSGLFGIGVTYVLQMVLNIILKAKFGIIIANLTIPTAAIMVGVSILLSVLSGLIPSQSAAHKDPVVALRSGE